eukprot:TRINITY_DN17960_c0_g1_i1.p1 TRINITY_DN17960_c0_g1~~TRINITY_DN17960_c0_g1_i1.p1  ORF type:complete len:1327 (-),score=359.53 TRINITY_DN17960_c0_g1_i1:111-4091(-)
MAAAPETSYSYVQENLIFYLNGKRVEIAGAEVDPQMTLAEYLRSTGFTGTKVGCAEGGCGACTVMISVYEPENQVVRHRSVAACLLPLPYVDHMQVTTVEGISKSPALHPIQEHLAKKHGTQCGFCTPGVVMSLYSTATAREAESGAPLTEADIEQCLDGNLCRCTGYRTILEAAHVLASDYKLEGKLAADAEATTKPGCVRERVHQIVAALGFPEELKMAPRPLRLIGSQAAWYRPATLSELLDLKGEVPNAQLIGGKQAYPERKHDKPLIISGNTEIGYKARYHPRRPDSYPMYVSTAAVRELRTVEWTDAGVRVGVATTINGLVDVLRARVVNDDAFKDEGFRAICHHLHYFANNQVRDMGTLGGSLITCDPLSDLYPALVAMNASVRLASRTGTRDVLIDNFVVGANKTALHPDEVCASLFIPYTRQREYVASHKVSKRRVDAQAMVNAGLRAALEERDGGLFVKDCTLAFGAVGPRAAYRVCKTEEFLKGKPVDLDTLKGATKVMREELEQVVVKSRGNTTYRLSVACSLLCRFFAYIANREKAVLGALNKELCSAVEPEEHHVHKGLQDYEDPAEGSSVGRPVPHLAAEKHVTGAAQFIGDIPPPAGCLHAAYVTSTRAHARIIKIDASAALAIPGVHAVVTAKDVPGCNLLGSLKNDEEVLASKEVVFYAQPVAIAVAESHRLAQMAAQQVKVEYEDLPLIQTIDEAIAAKSYLCEEKVLERGDCKQILDSWPKERLITGEIVSGGQEHFYIEPQACLVIPTGDNYFVRVTSQNPSKMQRAVATVLGIPFHRVESRMERIGGGFGGKQDRPQFLAASCSLASCVTGHPIRMVLEREQDMQVTGQRHQFKTTYRLAYEPDGRIAAAELHMYSNGGCSLDLSPAVMEVAMFAVDGCYHLPALRMVGTCCRTNRVSCTAYRGFGKPQAMVINESLLDHVACAAHLSVQQVRDANLLKPTETLMDETPVEDSLYQCYKPLREKFDQKLADVTKFNEANVYRKRGISLVPSRNNVGFEADCLNQGGCLVNVYLDGTVFISHGGSEMGQGLHTKCAQIAADALKCPLEMVTVGSTATDRVPNTTATAASTGSDLNGSAVLDGCTKLRARLDAVSKESGVTEWSALISEAYNRCVWLSEVGHHKFESYAYNWETRKGRSTLYHIWGAALCVVELDVLTGRYTTISLDIIQDVGRSLNPAIDIGQIEGGVMQGIGLFTLEEYSWASDGHLRTRNVSTYKIPTHDDVPLEMNIALLKNSRSQLGVHGNKSPSEVGVQLGISVLSALKDAMYAARRQLCAPEEAGRYVRIDTPATCEKIRLACPTPFDQ